jgi:hypothetical protein
MAGTPWRWTIYDAVTFTTVTLELNPSAGGSPGLAKNITTKTTSAVDGHSLLFEGRDTPPVGSVTGSILTQSAYNTFVNLYSLRRQQLLTDDLGRQFWIYITKFTPVRAPSSSHPWRHTYTLEFCILDNVGSPYSFA